jgi:hypothetical protein
MASAKVRVVSRFRPLNSVEKQCGSRLCVKYDDGDHPGSVGIEDVEGSAPNMFHFDNVFPTTSTQAEVYEYCGKHLVKEALNGFNCTVFAYGQTGSGKTFTMMGPPPRREMDPSLRGLIPRIIEEIFASIADANEELEFTVKVSYAEIYMEKLRDLIDPQHLVNDFGSGEKKKALRIRQDKQRGVYIEGITELYTSNPTEVLEIMMRGNVHRAIASTRMNQDSSRSHSVFTVTVTNRNMRTTVSKESKLVLIDLAGSEMVKKTAATGQTMKEAQTINKSLSALGNVIMALTTRRRHVPYRDSVLTRLLSDSLGGNSKTSLIITVSPAAYNITETLSTLRFGERAKRITNRPTVNEQMGIEQYKAIVKDLKVEQTRLRGWVKLLERELIDAGLEVPDKETLVLHSFEEEEEEEEEDAKGAIRAAGTTATDAAAGGALSSSATPSAAVDAIAATDGTAAAGAATGAVAAAAPSGTVTVHLSHEELERISNLIALNKELEAKLLVLTKGAQRRRRSSRRASSGSFDSSGDGDGDGGVSDVSDLSEEGLDDGGDGGASAAAVEPAVEPVAEPAAEFPPMVCVECREFGLVADVDGDSPPNACSVCGIIISAEDLEAAALAAADADHAAAAPPKPTRRASIEPAPPSLPPRAGAAAAAAASANALSSKASDELHARVKASEERAHMLQVKLRNRDDNLKFLELSMTEYTAMYRTSIVEHQMKQTKLEAQIESLRAGMRQMELDAERNVAELALGLESSPIGSGDWRQFEEKLATARRGSDGSEMGSPRAPETPPSASSAAGAEGASGVPDGDASLKSPSPQAQGRMSFLSSLVSSSRLSRRASEKGVPKTLRGRKRGSGSGGSNPIKTLRGVRKD